MHDVVAISALPCFPVSNVCFIEIIIKTEHIPQGDADTPLAAEEGACS